ncbi:unnamed protein product [Linum tenue]|uniref:GDSL esterase/lipase n=1 Tax=Linum tenue TaxID=586396 RepID=A0AAV0QUX6_9ROSI|nr:unnamed protein product [Linum tenue]
MHLPRTAAAATTALIIIILTAAVDILVITASPNQQLPNFTAVIIFGDSTVDTGNNNYLPDAVFRADHRPYGENFPTGQPTGRFSDGKLLPDFFASILGIKQLVPPFLHPNLSDSDIRTGVSFASAGTGYDDLTATIAQAISMDEQVEMFEEYVARLRRVVGDDAAKETVHGALVAVSAGANDFMTRRLEFDLSGYQDFLLSKVQNLVKRIYNMGGRTIVVGGLPPIGCLPIQMTVKLKNPFDRRCVETQNQGSQSYNAKLKKLLAKLQSSLAGSTVTYSNVYDPLLDMITHPSKYGFVETKQGCCGSGLVEMAALCNEESPTCGKEMASNYVFWDSVHPTSTAYQILATNLSQQLASALSSASPPSS